MHANDSLGNGSLIPAAATSIAMCVAAWCVGGFLPPLGNAGICLPSANLWQLAPTASHLIGFALICGIAIALYFINRAYTIAQRQEGVATSLFLIITCANPMLTYGPGDSAILAAVNLASMAILLSCYKQRNATQELFAVATLLSVGSMFEYAFIFMIPAYIIIGVMMKCVHFREVLAFLLGLIAPYWVALGLGLVQPSDFNLPAIQPHPGDLASREDILIELITTGISVIVLIVLSLYNGIKLYAGNPQRRISNNAFSLLAALCLVCMVLDTDNIRTYLMTVNIAVALQYANLFALWNIAKPRLVLLLISVAYIASFILMIL